MQPSDSGHTGQRVGRVMAAAMTPPTLAPSLSRRSWQDQGLITGLSTGSHYLMTIGAQDVIDVVAGLAASSAALPRQLVRRSPPLGGRARQRARGGAPGAGPHGIPRPCGCLHPGAWRGAAGGVASRDHRAVRLRAHGGAGRGAVPRPGGRRRRAAGRPAPLDPGRPAHRSRHRARPGDGARAHHRGSWTRPRDRGDDVPTVPGLAAGAAVLAVLWGAGWAERWTADQVRRLAPGPIPGSGLVWRLASHAAFAAVAGLGVNALWSRAMQNIEAGSSDVDPWMQAAPGVWTHPMVSGDPASLVSWDSLGREGRRHAVTYVRPEAMTERPALPGGGVPEDLSIPTVMGEPARAHPVQVFVGLDSAPTPDRAGRARHRRDGPHRRLVPLDAHARLADGHRLRQLRRGRRRAVPHPRRRRERHDAVLQAPVAAVAGQGP